jgi:hypothetical protein
MRAMIKFASPVDAGNTTVPSGKVDKVFQSVPESS